MDTAHHESAPLQFRMSEVLRRMDEILDNLSLYLKYMEFDLEATRRENRQLRQLLDRASL